ncbi:MAG: hypothetical protein WC998_07400 [Candidatus Paceibacterota bacterium]|jgi:hypothetical protein
MKLGDFTFPRMSVTGSPLWFIRAKIQSESPWSKKDAFLIVKDYESRGYLAIVKGVRHSNGTAWVVYIRKKSKPMTEEERENRNEMISRRNEESVRRHKREMGF